MKYLPTRSMPFAQLCSAAGLACVLATPLVQAQTTQRARPTGPGEIASQPMDPRATPAQKKPAKAGAQAGPASAPR